MGNYFNTNESKTHLAAKEKLFDLIVSKRIKIIDQYNHEYKIFTGEYEDEFLHVESFIMDYDNKAIFSNSDSPCKKYFEDKPKKKPSCSMEGYYGAFKELPCSGCINSNFRRETNHSSNLASYRPDVSFGYSGEHKVWLEIKVSNGSSEKKIEFCRDKGIVLLEIEASAVNNFKDYVGTLQFTKLEEYVYEVNIFDCTKEIVEHVKNQLDVSDYVPYNDMLDKFEDVANTLNVSARDLIRLQNIISENFTIVTTDNKIAKEYFNLKKKLKIITSKTHGEILSQKLNENKTIPTKAKNQKRLCHKCRKKEDAEKMMRIEIDTKGKELFRYYHKECYLGTV